MPASGQPPRTCTAASGAPRRTSRKNSGRLEEVAAIRALFYEYGDKFNFDPIMLAAQGYQESRLDQGAKSHVGSAGFMQVMPATGKELDVGDIRQMRSLAQERGLNPDVWFNNVEIVTAEKVGMETTTYVRNIHKYYVAYKLSMQARESQRKARDQVAPAARP